MTRDTDQRHYYVVEIVDVTGDREVPLERHEVEDGEEAADMVKKLTGSDKVQWPYQVIVQRMTNLTAPLTEEEEQELEDWIAGMGESEDDSDDVEEIVQEEKDSHDHIPEDYTYQVTEDESVDLREGMTVRDTGFEEHRPRAEVVEVLDFVPTMVVVNYEDDPGNEEHTVAAERLEVV